MVLSSLHTNDAPSALTRLNEMGVEPFLASAAVSGVLAQRLARRLCTNCAEMYTPSVGEMIGSNVSPDVAAQLDGMAFYRKIGCPRCNHTGYKGRLGIFEFLNMSDELAAYAASKPSHEEMRARAFEMGMRSMWDDGMAKVAQGLTSIEELARVVAT
jgi:type IV pilus assembly protein PilB